MIKAGVAFAYAEPEGMVISRSADECAVALMDRGIWITLFEGRRLKGSFSCILFWMWLRFRN